MAEEHDSWILSTFSVNVDDFKKKVTDTVSDTIDRTTTAVSEGGSTPAPAPITISSHHDSRVHMDRALICKSARRLQLVDSPPSIP